MFQRTPSHSGARARTRRLALARSRERAVVPVPSLERLRLRLRDRRLRLRRDRLGASPCGKGLSVAVLEMGKRWAKEDFPRTNGMSASTFGFRRRALRHPPDDTGEGCLLPPRRGRRRRQPRLREHAARAARRAFTDARWVGQDWKDALVPHYATAKRMLGVTESPVVVETDRMLEEVAEEWATVTPEAGRRRRLFRRARQDRPRSLFRRRRP